MFYKPQQNRNSGLIYEVTAALAGKMFPATFPTFELTGRSPR